MGYKSKKTVKPSGIKDQNDENQKRIDDENWRKKLEKLVDKNTAFPCRKCRKRDSCFIQPKDGKCLGLEEGIPWSVEFNRMCANLSQQDNNYHSEVYEECD